MINSDRFDLLYHLKDELLLKSGCFHDDSRKLLGGFFEVTDCLVVQLEELEQG